MGSDISSVYRIPDRTFHSSPDSKCVLQLPIDRSVKGTQKNTWLIKQFGIKSVSARRVQIYGHVNPADLFGL